MARDALVRHCGDVNTLLLLNLKEETTFAVKQSRLTHVPISKPHFST